MAVVTNDTCIIGMECVPCLTRGWDWWSGIWSVCCPVGAQAPPGNYSHWVLQPQGAEECPPSAATTTESTIEGGGGGGLVAIVTLGVLLGVALLVLGFLALYVLGFCRRFSSRRRGGGGGGGGGIEYENLVEDQEEVVLVDMASPAVLNLNPLLHPRKSTRPHIPPVRLHYR